MSSSCFCWSYQNLLSRSLSVYDDKVRKCNRSWLAYESVVEFRRRNSDDFSCSSLENLILVHESILRDGRITLLSRNILSLHLVALRNSVSDLAVSLAEDVLRFYRRNKSVVTCMRSRVRFVIMRIEWVKVYQGSNNEDQLLPIEQGRFSALERCV